VENSIKKGFYNGVWKPIPAPEDPTSQDIAYGHKIKKGENFSKGLTDSQATTLLKKDLEDAKVKVDAYLKKHNLPTNLNQQQWEMLIDYAFNLGSLNKFPNMTKAVVEGDLISAKREYKRFATIGGRKQELGRNAKFYDRYLANTKSATWKGRVA
jgi:GH24 family phage-related lysozyme (muramidase)